MAEVMRRVQPLRGFDVLGERFHYCGESYNSAWHNERSVEVAIALRYLRRNRGGRVLEVGNVLGHYTAVSHDVVDKYEVAAGVHNVDVLDFRPEGMYDLIVSVSTLEHVGWDEDVREPDKPVRAVAHLKEMLAPGGTLLATLPLGYNPHADSVARSNLFAFDRIAFMRRVSRDNRWREVPVASLGHVAYGSPFPAANAIAVGLAGSGRPPERHPGG